MVEKDGLGIRSLEKNVHSAEMETEHMEFTGKTEGPRDSEEEENRS